MFRNNCPTMMIISVMLIAISLVVNSKDVKLLQVELQQARESMQQLEWDNKSLHEEIESYIDDLEEVRTILSSWEVKEFEVTGYAPLDPNAVEGMCYSGDPNVTASGAQVVPGVTVAAGPDIPFGTPLYIEGLGWREVQDRGGRIGNGNLDVVFSSRGDAQRFGRKTLTVVLPNGNLP